MMHTLLRILSSLALAFVACSCRHLPEPFPIGLYDVPTNHFPQVAASGFNLVVTKPSLPVLDLAQQFNLKLLANPGFGLQSSASDLSFLRPLDQHPALWGWYLFDEPDMHRVAPRKVAAIRTNLRRHARKPSVVVLTSGSAVEKYHESADLMGVDWYPVPWAPVATTAREMRLARLAAEGRPFLAVIQAFDWKSAPELLRTDTPLRPPTAEEIKCMAFIALSQGASGLLFYTYETPKWALYDHPDLWAGVAQLAA
ncbi:MAG TPA: hypothetical protein VK633_01235, partial [Verrucomicrobiae bacterium]|nr:hypothetical protein [Verrucomicrobiae bacterium]